MLNTAKIRAVSAAKAAVKARRLPPSAGPALEDIYQGQPKDRVLSPKRASKADASKQKQAEDQPPGVIPDEEADIDAPYWTAASDSEVLIAEIPNNNNRWSQANFSRQLFEEFFGAACGENGMYRILLKHVGADGTMGKTEVRPGVSVASRNYRFELDAAKGLPYPNGPERPIGVFVKVSPRDFVYTLLMLKPGVYGPSRYRS